jgi:hypothetical protein
LGQEGASGAILLGKPAAAAWRRLRSRKRRRPRHRIRQTGFRVAEQIFASRATPSVRRGNEALHFGNIAENRLGTEYRRIACNTEKQDRSRCLKGKDGLNRYRTHNPKVGGSNPSPASNNLQSGLASECERFSRSMSRSTL